MSKNSDFLSTLKSIANNVQLGNKSATDVADSVNAWIKESSEALKVKIEDEVERSVSKMGFVKRGEFEALKPQGARKRLPPKRVQLVRVPRKRVSKRLLRNLLQRRMLNNGADESIDTGSIQRRVSG
jgi:BMFP domain-containing protein YqiC